MCEQPITDATNVLSDKIKLKKLTNTMMCLEAPELGLWRAGIPYPHLFKKQ